MLSQRGRVEATDASRVWVSLYAKPTCGGCSSLCAWVSTRHTPHCLALNLPPDVPLAVGDQVMLGIDAKHLLMALMGLLLLPLMTMLVAAVSAEWLIPGSELATAISGCIGFIVSQYCSLCSLRGHLGEPRIHFLGLLPQGR